MGGNKTYIFPCTQCLLKINQLLDRENLFFIVTCTISKITWNHNDTPYLFKHLKYFRVGIINTVYT